MSAPCSRTSGGGGRSAIPSCSKSSRSDSHALAADDRASEDCAPPAAPALERTRIGPSPGAVNVVAASRAVIRMALTAAFASTVAPVPSTAIPTDRP